MPIAVYKDGMWTFTKFLAVGAACYCLVAVWMYYSQKRLLYFPSTDHVATPDQIGLDYEDVQMTTRLGTNIHGWWLPRKDARFIILFAHGNGGNISHRLETFRIFNQLGVSTFIYDYSGYGLSEGDTTEEAMYADARAAWDWLVIEKGIAPEKIILFGRSLGGAVTARLARELADEKVSPAGLVMESTFTSVPDMGAYIYPWLPIRRLAKYRYDSLDALSGIDIPALFAHSDSDEIVPYALGLKLFESYGGRKSFMRLPGDHNGGYMMMGSAYANGINQFLNGLEQN